eukprot:m.10482 g.10482  ORF g.10482 m.10482 type:complete len:97 (+) comp5572_c0_seq1:1386-1676(+)
MAARAFYHCFVEFGCHVCDTVVNCVLAPTDCRLLYYLGECYSLSHDMRVGFIVLFLMNCVSPVCGEGHSCLCIILPLQKLGRRSFTQAKKWRYMKP